jgi:hypothetical protein
VKQAELSSIDQGSGKRHAAATSHHGVAESCGTAICDHIAVCSFLAHAPFDIRRLHKACEHKRRVRDRPTVNAGPLQLL